MDLFVDEILQISVAGAREAKFVRPLSVLQPREHLKSRWAGAELRSADD